MEEHKNDSAHPKTGIHTLTHSTLGTVPTTWDLCKNTNIPCVPEQSFSFLPFVVDKNVGTVPKLSVHIPVSPTHALEDLSEPLNQDTEGWITVKKNSRKKAAVTFL
jgi:hypothetical protein